MSLRTVAKRRFRPRRDVCPICGYRHDGDCDPVVLRAIDAADKRADCMTCIQLHDLSRDLNLVEAMSWRAEMARRYPEEYAELY